MRSRFVTATSSPEGLVLHRYPYFFFRIETTRRSTVRLGCGREHCFHQFDIHLDVTATPSCEPAMFILAMGAQYSSDQASGNFDASNAASVGGFSRLTVSAVTSRLEIWVTKTRQSGFITGITAVEANHSRDT